MLLLVINIPSWVQAITIGTKHFTVGDVADFFYGWLSVGQSKLFFTYQARSEAFAATVPRGVHDDIFSVLLVSGAVIFVLEFEQIYRQVVTQLGELAITVFLHL